MKFVQSLCLSLSLSLHFNAYTSTNFCRYRHTGVSVRVGL